MFEFGGEMAAYLHGGGVLLQAIGEGAAAQGQDALARLEPVASEPYRTQNQQILGTILSAASRFINFIIIAAIIISTGFVVWGFIKLNGASEDPRKRNGAILQIALSTIAAGGSSLAFVFIGLGVELGSVLTGGAGVDVGALGSGENASANTRPLGDLLGFYGEVAVVCDENVETTTEVDDVAQWTYDDADEECTRVGS